MDVKTNIIPENMNKNIARLKNPGNYTTEFVDKMIFLNVNLA